jgi:hypothetical protein
VDIHVSTGQWIPYFAQVMSGNPDTPLCFHLPSTAHVHAFLIVKEDLFPKAPFEFKLEQAVVLK